jgi:large subunit ribosomal protein L9
MKLLLLESVDGLGRPGDQVNVKNGYARNFLLPRRKAVKATGDSLRMLDSLRRKAEEEDRIMISSMEELAQKLKGTEITVEARATEEGHLFGSVTEKDIHLALVAAGWDVEQRMVRMTAHLKDAGVEVVEMHLYGEISVSISVNVVAVDMDGSLVDLTEAPAEDEDHDTDDEPDDASGESDGEAVTSSADATPAAADA